MMKPRNIQQFEDIMTNRHIAMNKGQRWDWGPFFLDLKSSM